MKNHANLANILSKFKNILPSHLDASQKRKPTDFTRNRKLPFRQLITFILHIVAGDKNKGIDSKSGLFFKNARRAGLLPDASAIHRSSLTKARKKVQWEIFQSILQKAVALAYELWPKEEKHLWHGMSVFAIDGSKYTLPATDALRKEFDPESGLEYPGKGHYPKCLVSTLFDLFRKFPIARTIAPCNTSERDEALKLLPYLPPGNLIIFDKGYPSYELLLNLTEKNEGYFLFRCAATSTFAAVTAFTQSQNDEQIIYIAPTDTYRKKVGSKQFRALGPIKIRVIRMINSEGKISVLLTNMLDRKKFTRSEILDLYYQRYQIEVGYRHEKDAVDVETFHGKTSNSIRQEIFSEAIMTVMARTMSVIAEQAYEPGHKECQLKNAVIALAADMAILVSKDPEKAISIFKQLLQEMVRVKYYRPKQPRPSQPRITKRQANKWITRRKKNGSP